MSAKPSVLSTTRRRALEDAVGEVGDHAAEVVGLRERRSARPWSLAVSRIVRVGAEQIGMLKLERALRADDVEHVGRFAAETRVETRDAAAVELHRRVDAGVDFGEARIAAVAARHGLNLDGLAAEDVARGVDAIHADVLQRPAPMILARGGDSCAPTWKQKVLEKNLGSPIAPCRIRLHDLGSCRDRCAAGRPWTDTRLPASPRRPWPGLARQWSPAASRTRMCSRCFAACSA